MLHQARQAHPELQFDEGDAEALLYADDSFDAVVSNFGIHHVPPSGQGNRRVVPGVCGRAGGSRSRLGRRRPRISPGGCCSMRSASTRPRCGEDAAIGRQSRPAEAVLRLLGDAGFAAAQAEPIRREWCVDDPRDLLGALAQGRCAPPR